MPVERRGQATQIKMESTGNRRNSCLGEAQPGFLGVARAG
jgi:hypothetical protein